MNVQSITFRSLKFTWYPQFVQSKCYSSMLRAADIALKASTREERLTKFRAASYDSASDRSAYMIENPNVQMSGTSPGKGGFFSRLGNVFKSRNNSRNKSNESSSSSRPRLDTLGERKKINTPWRRGEFSAVADVNKPTRRTAYDEWITREWWEFVDVKSWNEVNSNVEFERGLTKMMPSWMPVVRSVCLDLLNVMHEERIMNAVQSVKDNNILVAPLKVLDQKSNLTPEILENSYLNDKESYPKSEAARRIHPDDPAAFKNIISATPSSILSKSAQYIHLLSLQLNLRGIVVFYCNIICNSYRSQAEEVSSSGSFLSKSVFSWGRNGRGSIQIDQDVNEEIPEYAAARNKFAKLLMNVSTQHESAIQSPVYCEKFAAQYGDTFSPEGGKRLCVLTQTREGEGLLYLLDSSLEYDRELSSFNTPSDTISKPISCVINLGLLTRMTPAESIFSTIDLHDNTGLIWQLHPEGVDDDDANASTARLLYYISLYMNKAAVVIKVVKQGFLMKKGAFNRSYQQRWFVLSSDCKLHYYKFENGQRQGTIDIAGVHRVQYTEMVHR